VPVGDRFVWQSCAVNTRNVVVTILALTLLSTLAGCGGKRTEVVTWWALPDRTGSEDLAQACSDVADGYRVEVRTLPESFAQRRADLIRRLSADDDSIDVLSLDGALTAEFAAAQYLAALPKDLRATTGLVPSSVAGASYKGKLVAVPWWVDPQVLWYRGAAAERAGIDVAKPVSWNKLLAGANRVRASVQIDDPDGTGLSEWVRGLVTNAGGTVLQGIDRKPRVGLNTPAGRSAAGIIQFYAASGLGAGPSDLAPGEFAGSRGAFLVARASVRSQSVLAPVASDMRPLPYPVVSGASRSPVASAALAVPASSDEPKAAFDAIRCLTTPESEQKVMVNAGVGAAREITYTRPQTREALPFADVLLTAARTGSNVPSSPYWHRAERALQATWTPLSAVNPKTTPEKSAKTVVDAVGGGL
jgi:multiple sugar transport system substrate-binding protein